MSTGGIVGGSVGGVVGNIQGRIVGGSSAPVVSSLLTDLVSWWPLDETSGTRHDAHGSNDLTDNNTVLYDTGKQVNAASFSRANSETLSVSGSHGLHGGARDYTFGMWFYLNDNAVYTRGLACCVTDWDLHYISTNLQFRVNASTWQAVSWGSAPSFAAWHCVICSYEAATKTMSISLDNGTPATAVLSGTEAQGGGAFYLGRDREGYYHQGLADEPAFWPRLLTSDERTEYYNSGAGIAYPG